MSEVNFDDAIRELREIFIKIDDFRIKYRPLLEMGLERELVNEQPFEPEKEPESAEISMPDREAVIKKIMAKYSK